MPQEIPAYPVRVVVRSAPLLAVPDVFLRSISTRRFKVRDCMCFWDLPGRNCMSSLHSRLPLMRSERRMHQMPAWLLYQSQRQHVCLDMSKQDIPQWSSLLILPHKLPILQLHSVPQLCFQQHSLSGQMPDLLSISHVLQRSDLLEM